MKSSQTFIIIGNGVAAWRVNAELERKFVDAKILRIANENFAPACSYRTTAINCLRGTQKGLSPLGDLIVDSHEEFCAFMQEHSPEGVFKTHEYQLWDKNNLESDTKWLRRYGAFKEFDEVMGLKLSKNYRGVKNEAFLIEPYAFKTWHDQRLKRTEIINDYVTEVVQTEKGPEVKTQSSKIFKADKLILCAGHLSPGFEGVITEDKALDYLERSKPVRGSYLIGKSPKVAQSFSLAFENKHLIFRNGQVLIGSSSENNSSVLLAREEELREIYEFVRGHLETPDILPAFESMEQKVGVRHKGSKRTPWWGECSKNIYGVFGLYKNGFSFSFKAARELLSLIE